MARKKTLELVAKICLYGTGKIGHGWLACTKKESQKILGGGELYRGGGLPGQARGATGLERCGAWIPGDLTAREENVMSKIDLFRWLVRQAVMRALTEVYGVKRR